MNNFKLMTDPKWRVDLSPAAEKKLDQWLEENDYGATIDGEFIPDPQLSVGQLIHYMKDGNVFDGIAFDGEKNVWIVRIIEYYFEDEQLLEALQEAVREILEQKN